MDRREFAQLVGAGLASAAMAQEGADDVDYRKLPRWRGFNLLEKFWGEHQGPFVETDFAWMAEWGFDFVRLPLSYRCWADVDDWLNLDEDVLKEIDEAVEFGRKYGIHVNINFHRAPGYCVNPPKEPLDLWGDEEALDVAEE